MSKEDFDIESLAAYLHLLPQQISRMADRGKLPGRKIGGDWRFSQAEIHHWLEEQIGASDESELIEVEGVLHHADRHANPEVVSLSELLPVEGISIPLQARTKNSVINGMIQCASNTGFLWDPDKMADAVRARENLHPTAMENGVALLHPRRPMSTILAEPFLALGRTHQGIPFGGDHGGLTDIFFLICSVEDRGHLRVLARLSRLVSDASFLTELRGADDAASAKRLIEETESQLTN